MEFVYLLSVPLATELFTLCEPLYHYPKDYTDLVHCAMH